MHKESRLTSELCLANCAYDLWQYQVQPAFKLLPSPHPYTLLYKFYLQPLYVISQRPSDPFDLLLEPYDLYNLENFTVPHSFLTWEVLYFCRVSVVIALACT